MSYFDKNWGLKAKHDKNGAQLCLGEALTTMLTVKIREEGHRAIFGMKRREGAYRRGGERSEGSRSFFFTSTLQVGLSLHLLVIYFVSLWPAGPEWFSFGMLMSRLSGEKYPIHLMRK